MSKIYSLPKGTQLLVFAGVALDEMEIPSKVAVSTPDTV